MSDSSHEPDLLREIIHEPEYQEATRRIFSSIRRADEVLEGLEFFLGRRAEMGMAVPRYDPAQFASWLSKPIGGKGRVRVVYHYDETSVTMLAHGSFPSVWMGSSSAELGPLRRAVPGRRICAEIISLRASLLGGGPCGRFGVP